MKKMLEYKLEIPIEISGKEVHTLTLRRPKAIDFEAVDSVDGINKKNIRLIANCAGITPSEASDLDAYDFHEISSILGDFISKKPSEMTAKS